MKRNWPSSVKPKAPVKPQRRRRPTGPLLVGLVLESWLWVHWQVEEVEVQEVVVDSRGNRYLCDLGYGLCERID